MANGITKKKRQESKLIKKVLKASSKFLAEARDFYVKSMMLFDGQMGRYVADGNILYTNHCITASNTSNGTHFVDKEGYAEQEEKAASKTRRRMMIRSLSSFGVERIDEDKVCEFGDEVMVRTRSSYVLGRTKY